MKYKKEKQFFFLTVFVISLLFTKYYFLCTHEYYPPAQSEQIANFEAAKVFQKRFLTPVLALALSKTTSISFDHSLKIIVFFATIALIYGFKEMLNLFVSNDPFQYISIFVYCSNFMELHSLKFDFSCIRYTNNLYVLLGGSFVQEKQIFNFLYTIYNLHS